MYVKLNMREVEVTIPNKHGLHARPATRFVQLASKYESNIEVIKDNIVADGKSVTSMLTLNATKGTSLKIRATGPDADEAVEELAALVKSGFGENDQKDG